MRYSRFHKATINSEEVIKMVCDHCNIPYPEVKKKKKKKNKKQKGLDSI